MDRIKDGFQKIRWRYAPQDPKAKDELEARITQTARKRGLLTYSDLVRGVTFHLPSLTEPEHTIDPTDWQELDRVIVGDFLGYLSMESYERAGFFISALVVSKLDGTPGDGFYNMLKDLGLIAGTKTDKAMYLWADHVSKAHTYFVSH